MYAFEKKLAIYNVCTIFNVKAIQESLWKYGYLYGFVISILPEKNQSFKQYNFSKLFAVLIGIIFKTDCIIQSHILT